MTGETLSENSSFLEWAAGKDFFSASVDPWERTNLLLIEIQKRSLAEQVLLLSWDYQNRRYTVLSQSPFHEDPLLDAKIQLRLLKKGLDGKRILFFDDLVQDYWLKTRLEDSRCEQLLLYPISEQNNIFDALIVINYSGWQDPVRVTEFFTFVSFVLNLSIQNSRLYFELKKKNKELRDWSQHVELRIEEGTKKLLEKESQYHALFEGANDGIIVHDESGHVIEANHVLCHFLGYTKSELLDLTWDCIGFGKSLLEQKAFFQKILKKEKVRPLETILQKKDGETFIAELSSRRVWFQGKETIQTFVRDISKRKNLEENLHEAKEKYRMLVESSLTGVFILQDGVIQFANGVFSDIIGYSKDELIDRNFYSLVSPDDRSMVKSNESRREQGDAVPEHYEARFIRKDGNECWGEVRSCRVMLDGRPSILGNLIDITKRKELELHLLETQKMKSIGTLAGGIAHDFNNLLGGILGYASLLLSEMSKDHPFYQDIYAIAETSKRGADLTNRLLAFARGGKYQVTTIDMNTIIDDVITILSHTIDRSIIIDTKKEKDLWPVKGDGAQLQQVIQNICLNSRDAMPNGGRLFLETQNIVYKDDSAKKIPGLSPGNYIQITITDTGIGIDETIRSRVFEPFFTTKPPGQGIGLGLAMVYGIVKNHDGIVNIESRVGEGTKVKIILPGIDHESDDFDKKNHSPKTILFVDDEEVIRQVGQRMLEKGGFSVITAKNGREAIEIYREKSTQISLVLVDVVMPEMGGKETHRRLSAINPNVKVVYTSGYGPSDKPEIREIGSDYFIQKPFQTEILINKIKNILQKNPL